jgi:hypothetical protein
MWPARPAGGWFRDPRRPCQFGPRPISGAPRVACCSGADSHRFAAIAQLVEHVIRNDGVGGSSPSCGTNQIKHLAKIASASKAARVGTVLANRLPKSTASMKKINFGPTSVRDYSGLHVVPAYSRFQRISNLESAIDPAKALWDTAGWLWSDRYPGVNRRDHPAAASAFDADLFRRCPDLEFFRDLADTAKHGGELHRGSVIFPERAPRLGERPNDLPSRLYQICSRLRCSGPCPRTPGRAWSGLK